jgi:adenylate kinase family enzyme
MKTVIIGNSGSGKTWLAKRLSAIEDVPIIHLDDLFWEPGGFDRKRSADVVHQLVEEGKRGDHWIVEGVFGELAQRFLDCADMLIWLDLEWSVCEARLEKRGSESKRHLDREQSAADLARLVEWAEKYRARSDLRSHAGHNSLFAEFGKARFRFTTENEVMAFLAEARPSALI